MNPSRKNHAGAVRRGGNVPRGRFPFSANNAPSFPPFYYFGAQLFTFNRRHFSIDDNFGGAQRSSAWSGARATLNKRAPTRRNRSAHSESASAVELHNSSSVELEEPFSDSDDEDENKLEKKKTKKPGLILPMPRRRIRTLSGMVPNVGYAPVWGGPTMCLSCLEFFDLPKQTEQYVSHLLDKHQIVITDIELIVDLKRYVEYWRHRFCKESIEKIFPVVIPDENDPLHVKMEKYYLMSEKLSEDRQLRERLALRRLEEVLACQQREREDDHFERQCLFCRYYVKGNRSKLIHHLYIIHHLNLGSPDNLVFVSEYLDALQSKIQNEICIFCEKQFPDQNLLSKHMREKGHREVNPDNDYYDKFYVINYLELGKKWCEVKNEDFEDSTTAFIDSDEEKEEESWNEWQGDKLDEDESLITCLFCDETFNQIDNMLKHMTIGHSFDLKKLVSDEKMNFYDRVKFVNYVRSMNYKCVCFACGKDDLRSWPALRKHLAEENHVTKPIDKEKWNKDEYLIPTYDNDALLCHLDELDDGQQKNDLPDDPAIVDKGPVEDPPEDSPVVAEDAPDLSYTILSDLSLREQLQ